jgi:hypothetical protein
VSEREEISDFLRANFTRLNERLDRVDTCLDELTIRIGSLARNVASLSLRIAELKVDFSACRAGWTRWIAGSIGSSGGWNWPTSQYRAEASGDSVLQLP